MNRVYNYLHCIHHVHYSEEGYVSTVCLHDLYIRALTVTESSNARLYQDITSYDKL